MHGEMRRKKSRKTIKLWKSLSKKSLRNPFSVMEDHIFFHSTEIQEQIRQSEEDIKAGRYVEFKASEIDKLLEWLDEVLTL